VGTRKNKSKAQGGLELAAGGEKKRKRKLVAGKTGQEKLILCQF